jgi:hypothetical protein
MSVRSLRGGPVAVPLVLSRDATLPLCGPVSSRIAPGALCVSARLLVCVGGGLS